MEKDEIIAMIQEAIKKQKTTPYRAAINAKLPGTAIRHIIKGIEPKLGRVVEVCKALNLELHVRPAESISTKSGHDEKKEKDAQEMFDVFRKTGAQPSSITEQRISIDEVYWKLVEYHQLLQEIFPHTIEKNKVAEPTTIYNLRPINEAHHVQVFEVDAAAGTGALNETEQVVSYVAFRPDWLKKHGLDPNQCAIIRVRGESMEPTLLDQSAVLVDRNRQRRHAGRIYVIRTDDALLVKRLDKDKKGNWLLASDNPDWEDMPLPRDAKIIGEVKWSGKTFP